MKKLVLSVMIVLCTYAGMAQVPDSTVTSSEGRISFITSGNVYVRFASTEGLHAGDTLFLSQDGKLVPVLVINNLSSISAVCSSLPDAPELAKDMSVRTLKSTFSTKKPAASQTDVTDTTTIIPVGVAQADKTTPPKAPSETDITGRLSVSSYSNFSSEAGNSQRMRYTLSLGAQHIGGTALSAESYISFAHSDQNWEKIKNNIFDGLKIYSLALNYQFDSTLQVWLGRRINPNLSNMGAVDGVQGVKRFEKFSVGVVAGFRPDYRDYSFNGKLFQAGIFGGHQYVGKQGMMQSSLAFVEQTNAGNTDRRFAYLQHSNALMRNTFLFGSAEVNFFKKINDTTDNTPSLTNLYLMVRYRFSRKLSASASYSARDNIIYYETYKDIVERLLEQETLHGYRLQLTYRPLKNIITGIRASYRVRNDDPQASSNIYGYVTINTLPGIRANVTLSAALLETAFLSGKIYGISLWRDLVPGKLSGSAGYRYVDYNFLSSEISVAQNIAEASFSWRILPKLFLMLNYEGTFDDTDTFNRVYVNLTQRF
jgi:hypothetical protein